MVFQNYALFPHMTVAENLDYPLRVRKISSAERRERVVKALSMVQMAALAERKPAQLSGGQQQRVALARAIIFEPSVVLMDEPLGALDKNLREHLQLEIKHLHEKLGITVVYVTHDQSEALTMSDRVAVFNAGKIEQLASPAHLYERPATPFVASFIGENNRLKGKVASKSDDGYTIATEVGDIRVSTGLAVAVGNEVVVSLRPERVSLERRDCTNGLEGTVEEVIYFGDHRKIYVRAPSGTILIAKVQNTDGWSELSSGTTVTLGWGLNDGVLVRA
jgi:putative spermidine/putrescine transport system ATP-binding protein